MKYITACILILFAAATGCKKDEETFCWQCDLIVTYETTVSGNTTRTEIQQTDTAFCNATEEAAVAVEQRGRADSSGFLQTGNPDDRFTYNARRDCHKH